MSDNKEKLQDALGMLDDDLLLEVEKLRRAPQKRHQSVWHRLTAIAACLCVLVGGAVAARFLNGRSERGEFLTADETATVTEGAATEEYVVEREEESEECVSVEEAAEEDIDEGDGLLDSENRSEETGTGASLASGVTIAPLRVDLYDHPDAEVDMEALFIYDGRCYVQYGSLADASHLAGDYLGTATGLIDEWTEKDGYVDLAGADGEPAYLHIPR